MKGRKRRYDNSLRAEQARNTHERILEAFTELMAEGGAGEVTIAEIARRAGVSEPTLYRHFGGRDQLYEELDLHIRRRLGMPMAWVELERMPRMARELFARFSEHETLLRAAVNTGLAKKVRERGRAKRTREMREAFARRAGHLPARDADAVGAVYRILLSWDAWERLTGELGVPADAAGDAIAWAIDALNRQLSADQAAGRGSIQLGDGDDQDDDDKEEGT